MDGPYGYGTDLGHPPVGAVHCAALASVLRISNVRAVVPRAANKNTYDRRWRSYLDVSMDGPYECGAYLGHPPVGAVHCAALTFVLPISNVRAAQWTAPTGAATLPL